MNIHSRVTEYLDVSISSKIFLAESAETRVPSGVLSSIIFRLFFFLTNACCENRPNRLVQDHLICRFSPEPAFLWRLM